MAGLGSQASHRSSPRRSTVIHSRFPVARTIKTVFLVYAVAMIHAIVIILIWFSGSPERYNPMRYSVQTVLTKMPVTPTDGLTIKVMGTKCSIADEPLVVRGTLTWQTLEPRGTTIQVGEGVREQKPGCESQVYDNPVPLPVLARTRTLLGNGLDRVVWQLTGIETVQHPNAAPQAWRTQNIVFVNPKE